MVSITDEFNLSVVVDATAIARITRFFENKVGPIGISVQCSDNISRNFSSANELNLFENSPSKAIHFLSIDASNYTDTKCPKSIRSVDLNFHASGGVTIRIYGTEQDGIYFRDELKEIVYGMQPWYGRIARSLASYMRTMFILLSWMAIVLYLFNITWLSNDPLSKVEWSPLYEVAAVVVGEMLIILIPFWVVNSAVAAFQRNVFPVVSYATGQGKGGKDMRKCGDGRF